MEELFLAFWTEVMLDLVQGNEDTRLWLDTGAETAGFLWWCETTSKQPQEWRTALLGLWAMRGTRKAPGLIKRLQRQD